ncbi:M10 family metallopeptidase [Phreatobacter sp.]|uniref:M10 family metallopeptidase n=1 Tax=Phreatobacter sp. TaxID=1966341 RepID=UPI0022BEC24F|nr:M10 family metallopeptidase [Phreatobacter sp.]MCZ8313843.1 M10 family metallopeptidase [Phreatobacter sp.]
MCIACSSSVSTITRSSFLHDGLGAGFSADPVEAGGTSQGATGNLGIDGLLSGVKWNGTPITYNFPTLSSYYGTFSTYGGYADFISGFVAVSASFQAMVTKALGEFSAVSGLAFTQVGSSDASDISVGRTSGLGTGSGTGFNGYGYYPGSSLRAGDIWFSSSTSDVGDTALLGRGTYRLVLHELGHAVGLKHGHEAGGPGATAMPTGLDFEDYSLMTYRRYEGSATSGVVGETAGRAQSLMMYDIAALQAMYGANFNTNSGNTVYSFSTTTGQMFIDGVGGDVPNANRIYRTIWDGGGIDTYDFSNYTTNLVVDLSPGGKSTLSTSQLAIVETSTNRTATGNLFNALQYNGDVRSLIENAIGGSGNDTITGNAAANDLRGGSGNDTISGRQGNDVIYGNEGSDTLSGNLGNDTLYGGTGDDVLSGGQQADVLDGGANADTASYAEQTTGLTASLFAPGTNTGAALGDTYVSIENLTGGSGNDTLEGDGGANELQGNDGNDILLGRQGDDLLRGGNGADELNGQLGNDTLFGDVGNDFLFGGVGNDTMTGGTGNDTFIFAASASGNDVIMDFEGAGATVADVIRFSTSVFGSFASVQAAMTTNADGVSTNITLSPGNVLVVKNVAINQWLASDFLFV